MVVPVPVVSRNVGTVPDPLPVNCVAVTELVSILFVPVEVALVVDPMSDTSVVMLVLVPDAPDSRIDVLVLVRILLVAAPIDPGDDVAPVELLLTPVFETVDVSFLVIKVV
jgi:hypothetical protein